MNRSFGIVFALLAVLSGAGGCQSMSAVLAEKQRGGGTSQTYPVSEDEAWDLARTVFRWEGTDAIEEHRSEGYMLTSTGMSLFTYGTVMGAWIEPVDPGNTTVTVVTKRRIATNHVTSLTETTFHRWFAQGVEILKAGEPLPLIRPN